MRVFVLLAAILVFVAGLIIEPAALVQIARICFSGYCGVRPKWLYAALALVFVAFVLALVIPRRPKPKAKPKRKAKPKPKGGTVLARNVTPKSRRVGKS